MDKHFTISCYFRVLDAEMYGGVGSIGYAAVNLNFENRMKGEPQDVVDISTKNLADTLKVSTENVISITREEYEENTEDDD